MHGMGLPTELLVVGWSSFLKQKRSGIHAQLAAAICFFDSFEKIYEFDSFSGFAFNLCTWYFHLKHARVVPAVRLGVGACSFRD